MADFFYERGSYLQFLHWRELNIADCDIPMAIGSKLLTELLTIVYKF